MSRKQVITLSVLVVIALSGGLFSFVNRGDDPTKNPEGNRFTPVVLTPEASLDEPMMFQVLKDGTVYIIERKGAFKKFDPLTKNVSLIHQFSVHTGSEQGLIGLEIDPNFSQNHQIYLLYSHPVESKFVLERYELLDDKLVLSAKRQLLEFPVDRENVNHTGGGMCWDAKGNLFITTGNNSGNQNLAQVDERPGFFKRDDQRTSANTNDLRGKILRIHPEPDGTYSIPDGNLFPKGTPKTRPEIYTMGHRNPWRVSIDSKTGYLYWGEIGPDKDSDGEDAPRGYDEFNQATGPGFFGWPYFIGNNIAYPKYDFEANKPGPKQDPMHPVNNSPNNTGINQLPPTQPAMIWYPYAVSEEFPLMGSSSRCAVGGPVYHRADFKNPARPWPTYYEGKWIAGEYSRFMILAITMDEAGTYKSMEKVAPDYHPVQQIDLKFGPDGDLYVLEYGGNTAKSALESRLIRIEYNAGNRKPIVQASSTKKGGAIPFQTTLSSAGTKDYDGDALTYEWKITGGGSAPRVFKTANPIVRFDKMGLYTAMLTVTDAKGSKNSASLRIIAGNEPPVVGMNVLGNKSFFFDGSPIQYSVDVSDKEDGTLASGRITPAQVAVSIDYASEGLDFVDITTSHQTVDASTQYSLAQTLMSKSDCNSCHMINTKVLGPAFTQIADKYKTDPDAVDKLARKIRSGGSGVWGEGNMPAHPSISLNDAGTIVKYILAIKDKGVKTLPIRGAYVAKIPDTDNGRGTYILRAAYKDKATTVPAQPTEAIVMLHSPIYLPLSADRIEGGAVRDQLDDYVFLTAKNNSFIAYKGLDLTGVKQIELKPNWHIYDIYKGGTVDIRLDSPTGELIGSTEITPDQFNLRRLGLFGPPPSPHAAASGAPATPPVQRPRVPRPTDRNTSTKSAKATIKETAGVHDLYFVFKNEKVTGPEALFPLFSVKFSDELR